MLHVCALKELRYQKAVTFGVQVLFGHGWELFEGKKEGKDITVQEKSIHKCDLSP